MEWIFRCAPACERASIGFGKIEYFRFNKMIESGDRGGWGMTHNAKVCGIVYYSVGLCVCVRHLNSLFGERAREREKLRLGCRPVCWLVCWMLDAHAFVYLCMCA